MLPQQVIKEMQGLADDSYGSHNLHTKSQLCKARINQDFLQTALFKATEKGCGETRGGVASHHRLREVLTEAQHLQAHSNSHDWHWSISGAYGVELPGRALSKRQVTHPLLSLRFPTVPPWWDNHGYASASLLIFTRRDLMEHSRHNLSLFACDSMAFSTKKHSMHYYVNMLWRQGHDSLISCSRWKIHKRKTPLRSSRRRRPCLKSPSSYRYLKRINGYLHKDAFV